MITRLQPYGDARAVAYRHDVARVLADAVGRV